MRIFYITSQYPMITETFIARELEQLLPLKNEITVGVLRPKPSPLGLKGISPTGIKTIRVKISLFSFVISHLLSFINRPKEYLGCLIDVIQCGASNPRYLINLFYIFSCVCVFFRTVLREEVDLIRGHFLHTEAISCYWLARLMEKPYSITAHVVTLRYNQHIIKKVVTNSAYNIAISGQTYNLLKQLGSRKTYMIKNGVDIESLEFKSELDYSIKTILGVGSLLPHKGFDTLIFACKCLLDLGIKFKCVIIGEGKERNAIEKLIVDLNLSEQVTLLGALPFSDVKKYMNNSNILVMPSKASKTSRDGLPTVLIEAMALGLPVIASNFVGIPELVKNGETGLLFSPGDASELAERIQFLFTSESEANRMRINGRKLVETEYNIRTNVRTLNRILSTIIKE